MNRVTVESKFINMLIGNGMSECQAKSVMEIAKPHINGIMSDYNINSILSGYNITWNTPSSDYPNVIYNVLYNEIKPIALKWINDNVPHAWFKPMFE